MPEMHRTKYVGVCVCGVCVCVVSMRFLVVSPLPSQYLSVFTNPEAFQIPLIKCFYRAQSPGPLSLCQGKLVDGAGSSNSLITWFLPDQPHPEAI